ncbi:MAG: hypothetical protein PHE73_08410 [Sulfurovaceae bacterium]|nr:hypothetical protein [Sulfurovaceae bacterium]
MLKNRKKSQETDPVREFYSVISEIIDLYQNQGYLKQKSLYEKMKKTHNWTMSYSTFNRYFVKEIKNKYLRPAPLGEDYNTKKNENIDNNYQKKENNENSKTAVKKEFSDEAYERYNKMNEAIDAKYGDYLKNQKNILDTEEKNK